MTHFQFVLIMRTLLVILGLKLHEHEEKAWEKAEKDYEDILGIFNIYKHVQNSDDEF